MSIAIPPYKADERIEDWQPLFVVATSALAAYAFRELEDRPGFCKIVKQEKKEEPRHSSDSDSDPEVKEVYKVQAPTGWQKGQYRGSDRRYSSLTCFTCGKMGNSYAVCRNCIWSRGSLVGTKEIPIELYDWKTHSVLVNVLEGEEQPPISEEILSSRFKKKQLEETHSPGLPKIKRIDNLAIKQLVSGCETDLNPRYHLILLEMLNEFEELFNDKPGRTTRCEHAIDTGNAVHANPDQDECPYIGKKKLTRS
ncbi:hypothetical protein LOD99_7389 [Oopsacas minuta]|uniref:Uncharacterized protein n=1 Tax=Oopsacas minuta TaxID=111878 RepID=A0AAV7JV73_9METZ|nr:hypothetical protein LOD99_7389 [Oopsacas minuta]